MYTNKKDNENIVYTSDSSLGANINNLAVLLLIAAVAYSIALYSRYSK